MNRNIYYLLPFSFVIFILAIILYKSNNFYEGYFSSYSAPSGMYSSNQYDNIKVKRNSLWQNYTFSPSISTPATTYDPGNINVNYHDTIDDIQAQSGNQDNTINVFDPTTGKMKQISVNGSFANTTYYDAGTLKFDPSNYVPKYEDTIYFSKLTGLGYQTPIYGSDSQWGGFCNYNKNFPQKIEEKCNTLDSNTCASTTCCTLLGGVKCVAGNENGPILKSHYSDLNIRDRNKYFYMGKCYGNCIDDQSYYYNYGQSDRLRINMKHQFPNYDTTNSSLYPYTSDYLKYMVNNSNDQTSKTVYGFDPTNGMCTPTSCSLIWPGCTTCGLDEYGNCKCNITSPSSSTVHTSNSNNLNCTLDEHNNTLLYKNGVIIKKNVFLNSNFDFVDINGDIVDCITAASPPGTSYTTTPPSGVSNNSIDSSCTLDKMGRLLDKNGVTIKKPVYLDSTLNFVDANGNPINCITVAK
jgi:hypothetical protein